MNRIVLSTLPHTWILDLDGTLLKHNGYLIDGVDSFLPGAKEFLQNIAENDYVIFLTSRNELYKDMTESFLKEHRIRYNNIIFGIPYGERLLINDYKPSGLQTSYGINVIRDDGIKSEFVLDDAL